MLTDFGDKMSEVLGLWLKEHENNICRPLGEGHRDIK